MRIPLGPHGSCWLIVAALGLSTACRGGDGDAQDNPDETGQSCLSNKEYFSKKVWKPILEQRCYSCHNVSGQAKATNLVLVPSSQTGYLDANMQALQKTARYEADGKSILLQKPIGGLEHQGGPILQEGSDEMAAIEQMLARFDEPVTCADTQTLETHFEGVELLDPQQTLRKTTLNLGGRLPTQEEEALIEDQGIDGLYMVVENLAKEEVFYERLREMFNDMFLTDRYRPNQDAVDLLSGEIFPQARWYHDREENDLTKEDPEEVEAARKYANVSVAREPLELIVHIVRNDLPFTQVLTADYMMVNPFTARVYGVEDVTFADKLDQDDWKPGHIPGQPHAGILTSPMFLNRFPTTATNRNRHRSRMAYNFFLATDVMALAERPLDPTSIEDFNPTLYNPQCTSCHAVIDPVAGAFQNWNDRGMYAPPEKGWFEDMRPPGFGEATIPFASRTESMSWLAEAMTSDPRFATATVHNLYRGITGHELVKAVGEDPAVYDNLVIAHDLQAEFFDKLAADFIAQDYNVKAIIKGLVKSPYFRIRNLPEGYDEAKRTQYEGIGSGRLLTPEILDRKIEAITGIPWTESYDKNRRMLLRTDRYRILYGGIDSNGVTERITDPNGIMANVQWRMANEISCRAVPLDFVEADREARHFFRYVEPGFIPEDDNGFIVSEAVNAIKQNIQHLHWQILGERLTLDDPEIERTYNIFYDTWKEGRELLAKDEISRDLRCRASRDFYTDEEFPQERRVERDPLYTIRAWQAVVTYLLSDYQFLYE